MHFNRAHTANSKECKFAKIAKKVPKSTNPIFAEQHRHKAPPRPNKDAPKMPSVDLFLGPLIQCAEAATLGMPFEVWKTRMGRFRQEGTMEAFANIYKQGGVKAFWAGTGPKMIESGSKVRDTERHHRSPSSETLANASQNAPNPHGGIPPEIPR
jgi:hypothetical protein